MNPVYVADFAHQVRRALLAERTDEHPLMLAATRLGPQDLAQLSPGMRKLQSAVRRYEMYYRPPRA